MLKDVCGVQVQEPPAALLSMHNRVVGLTASDVEWARQETHSIVRTWCMRGTLHLVTAENARWLVPFLGPTFITADRDKKFTYVLFQDWVGALRPLPHTIALAELARRYLEAYAPASPEDMASWSGLKISEIRQAWQLIQDQLTPLETANRSMWMLKTQFPWMDSIQTDQPIVRLLSKYDTYLLGYADRNLAVSHIYAKKVHPGGGVIRPTLMIDGRVQGIWTVKPRRAVLEVMVEPLKKTLRIKTGMPD